MAYRRLGPSQKRQQNTNNHQPIKRMRSDVEPNDTIKITDVNSDCLEHIFKYLGLGDLLNVADSSKYMKPVVDLVVASRYRMMHVFLHNIHPSHKQMVEVSELDCDILITDLTTCLKFLRCFGHLIDGLHMNYHGCARYHRVKVDQYVNEYCTASLHDIFVESASKWAMDSAKKPFLKVHSIRFKDCQLGGTLSALNKWFPVMHHLEFDQGNQTIDRKFIEKQFPFLEHLIVRNVDDKCQKKIAFGPENIAQALRLNPQLRTLHIPGNCFDAKFLQSVSKYLQSLETLRIGYSNENHLNLGNDVIHFGNIKTLEIVLTPFLPIIDDIHMPRIPLSFDQLEELTLSVSDVMLGGSFRDFIIQNPSIFKLILSSNCVDFDSLNETNKIELAKAAKLLKQINISGIQFSIEEAVDFINECKSMTKFVFQLQEHLDYVNLKQRLDQKWNASIDTMGFINLER